MKKMKRWMSCCLVAFVLCACHTMDIQVDWNRGVRYRVDNEKPSWITLYLDPQNEDVIAAMEISVWHEKEMEDQDILQQLQSDTNTLLKDRKTVISVVQFAHEDEGVNDDIQINFFKDELKPQDIELLMSWLGLEKEYQDGFLKYEEELLKSTTFRYRWVLSEGELMKNISVDGNPDYDYSR